MKDLKTIDDVKKALTEYRKDQLGVILGMADNRELDRDNLTLADYKGLILEEADFSIEVVAGRENDRDNGHVVDQKELLDEQAYAAALRAIADRIDAELPEIAS